MPPLSEPDHDPSYFFQAPCQSSSEAQPTESSSAGPSRPPPKPHRTAAEVTAAGLLRQMLQANWEYVDEATYKALYSDPAYKARCQQKLRKMRRLARTTNLSFIEDQRFWKEQFRLRRLYPDGGRGHLFDFIGKL